jgi:hypothetical protein
MSSARPSRNRARNRGIDTDVLVPLVQDATAAAIAVGGYVRAKVGRGKGDPSKS